MKKDFSIGKEGAFLFYFISSLVQTTAPVYRSVGFFPTDYYCRHFMVDITLELQTSGYHDVVIDVC